MGGRMEDFLASAGWNRMQGGSRALAVLEPLLAKAETLKNINPTYLRSHACNPDNIVYTYSVGGVSAAAVKAKGKLIEVTRHGHGKTQVLSFPLILTLDLPRILPPLVEQIKEDIHKLAIVHAILLIEVFSNAERKFVQQGFGKVGLKNGHRLFTFAMYLHLTGATQLLFSQGELELLCGGCAFEQYIPASLETHVMHFDATLACLPVANTESVAAVQRIMQEAVEFGGHGGVNPAYAQHQGGLRGNLVIVRENVFMIFRPYPAEMVLDLQSVPQTVLVVQRKLIASTPKVKGHAKALVQDFERRVFEHARHEGIRHVLIFLESVPSAERVHLLHGYTKIAQGGGWKNPTLWIMYKYFQPCGTTTRLLVESALDYLPNTEYHDEQLGKKDGLAPALPLE